VIISGTATTVQIGLVGASPQQVTSNAFVTFLTVLWFSSALVVSHYDLLLCAATVGL